MEITNGIKTFKRLTIFDLSSFDLSKLLQIEGC